MKRWVDSRLNIMTQKDAFYPIMKANVPARLLRRVREEHPAPEAASSTTRGRT